MADDVALWPDSNRGARCPERVSAPTDTAILQHSQRCGVAGSSDGSRRLCCLCRQASVSLFPTTHDQNCRIGSHFVDHPRLSTSERDSLDRGWRSSNDTFSSWPRKWVRSPKRLTSTMANVR